MFIVRKSRNCHPFQAYSKGEDFPPFENWIVFVVDRKLETFTDLAKFGYDKDEWDYSLYTRMTHRVYLNAPRKFETLTGSKNPLEHYNEWKYKYLAYRHKAMSEVSHVLLDGGRVLSEGIDYDGAEGAALGAAENTEDFIMVRQTASVLCAELLSIAVIAKESIEEDRLEIIQTCTKLLGPTTLPVMEDENHFYNSDKFALHLKYSQIIKRSYLDDPDKVKSWPFLFFSYFL